MAINFTRACMVMVQQNAAAALPRVRLELELDMADWLNLQINAGSGYPGNGAVVQPTIAGVTVPGSSIVCTCPSAQIAILNTAALNGAQASMP